MINTTDVMMNEANLNRLIYSMQPKQKIIENKLNKLKPISMWSKLYEIVQRGTENIWWKGFVDSCEPRVKDWRSAIIDNTIGDDEKGETMNQANQLQKETRSHVIVYCKPGELHILRDNCYLVCDTAESAAVVERVNIYLSQLHRQAPNRYGGHKRLKVMLMELHLTATECHLALSKPAQVNTPRFNPH